MDSQLIPKQRSSDKIFKNTPAQVFEKLREGEGILGGAGLAVL